MKTSAGCLANAGAQEASVILHAHLAAGQKICDRCHRFFAALRARTDCQDQITQRKPSARSHDLSKLCDFFSYVGHFWSEQVQCHESL